MASPILAALPVQTAATVLEAATNRSPIRAAYTAVVEDDRPPRHLLDASFKWRSRRSFCRGTIGNQKKCTRRSCSRCKRADNRGGVEPAHECGTGSAKNATNKPFGEGRDREVSLSGVGWL